MCQNGKKYSPTSHIINNISNTTSPVLAMTVKAQGGVPTTTPNKTDNSTYSTYSNNSAPNSGMSAASLSLSLLKPKKHRKRDKERRSPDSSDSALERRDSSDSVNSHSNVDGSQSTSMDSVDDSATSTSTIATNTSTTIESSLALPPKDPHSQAQVQSSHITPHKTNSCIQDASPNSSSVIAALSLLVKGNTETETTDDQCSDTVTTMTTNAIEPVDRKRSFDSASSTDISADTSLDCSVDPNVTAEVDTISPTLIADLPSHGKEKSLSKSTYNNGVLADACAGSDTFTATENMSPQKLNTVKTKTMLVSNGITNGSTDGI